MMPLKLIETRRTSQEELQRVKMDQRNCHREKY